MQDFAGKGALRYTASTYDAADNMLRDSDFGRGRRVITFANILRDKVVPLAPAIDFMLRQGQNAMQRPVEIEFAGNVFPVSNGDGIRGNLYWLQIRPIIDKRNLVSDQVLELPDSRLIVRSGHALGNGMAEGVSTIVYVKPASFDSLHTAEIVPVLQKINEDMRLREKNYVLIGPGRWGSSDPALGIPVRWADISQARVVVEAATGNFRVEPSQGTHFFQNLTSLGVGYLTVDPGADSGFYDSSWLDGLDAVFDDKYVRVIEFAGSLSIAIDGRSAWHN